MSHLSLRHFVLTLTLALVPLLPAVPAQAATSNSSSPTLSAATIKAIRDSGPPVMEQAASAEANAPLTYPKTAALPAAKPLAVTNPRLFREVMGFAFAGSLGDPTIGYPSWNMSLLSTVAYFGIHIDWTGGFSGDSGTTIWNDPNGPVPGFIAAAHSAGTKVVLTIEMFDSAPGTPNMCSALQRAGLTIQQAVAQVNAKGIDGVNVDYESDNTQCTDGNGVVQSSQSLFTSFVANLRAALPAGSYLSVDTYSGAAGYRSGSAYLGFFDIGALNNYVDSFMVMAYDMEYDNGLNPPMNCSTYCLGPTSPLSYYYWNQGRASAEYSAVVPASKVIMGMPYYGRKECVAGYTPSTAPPNALRAPGTGWVAEGYLDASTENGFSLNSDYHTHREVHDTPGNTEWDTFTSSQASCTRELYWDDTVALGNKYDLVINNHLRGVGIFALNYGGGAPELWNLINLKFGQCSQAAINADKSVPQIPGTSITFTGSALCAGTAQFRFWLSPPSGGWTLKQDYSGTSTWAWNTSGLAPGTYRIEVDARNLGATVSYDTTATYSFRLALCVTPTLASDQPSPRLPTTTETFTPSVTCQGTPEYRFFVLPPGGAWTMVQDYGAGSTLKWPPANTSYGDYLIGVHVRTVGTSVAYESYGSMPFSLTSCISPGVTADKASPQPTGTSIGLTGGATCDGTPQYRFMIQPPGGSMSVVRDFGGSSGYAWIAGGPGGTYTLEVDAKSSAAPATAMASATTSFTLSSCSTASVGSSPPSPQQPGPTVVFTATATCPATPQYRFTLQRPDGTSNIVQDYAAGNTYSWNTTSLAVGTYDMKVDVRDAGATDASEAAADNSYFLAHPPCTTASLSSNPASPQETGTQITFTGAGGGCVQPTYEFWMQPSGSTTWQLLQAYSTKSTYVWNTAGALTGTEQFEVWVKDAFSLGVNCPAGRGCNDTTASAAYSVVKPACPSVTIQVSPTSVLQGNGAHATVTAASGPCTNGPLYEFWLRPASDPNWVQVQAYSTSSTYDWNSAGAPAGTVYLGVHVKDSHSAASADAVASTAETVVAPCTSVALSASPTRVLLGSGAHVTITASAAGCPDSPLYELWLRSATSPWILVQAYSASATYDWNSTGAPAGTVYFGVHAKDSQSAAAYNVLGSTTVGVGPPSCSAVTVAAAPTSVVHNAGTHVTITASASGCTGPNAVYEFWMRTSTSSWQLVQPYSTSATYDWNTVGAPVTTVYFGVWAKDPNSPTASFDANASTTVSVT